MKLLKKILKINLPLKLIIVLLFSIIFGDSLALDFKRLCFSLSLSIKDLLVFILPVVIFSLLFACMLNLRRASLLFITLLILSLCASNFLSTFIAYGASNAMFSFLSSMNLGTVEISNGLTPMWNLNLPSWLPNEYALFSGIVLGTIFSCKQTDYVKRFSNYLLSITYFILQKALIPIIPIFILGFALEFQHLGIISKILQYYSGIFAAVLLTQITYLVFLYAFASKFNRKIFKKSLKNVLPSAIAAFSSMSSAAALPLTIEAAEKNTNSPEKARAIIPITVNVHLIGDSLWIPIVSLVMLSAFGIPQPSFTNYLIFALFFVLAKFAVAAVPGGGIIVMLPILSNHLGFSPEMLSLITALYILFDSFITMVNVLGNGAFAILFTKLYELLLTSVTSLPRNKKRQVQASTIDGTVSYNSNK